MSDQADKFNEVFEGVKTKAQDAMKDPAVAWSKSISFKNEHLIMAGLIFVAYKLNKGLVTKVVRKDSLIVKEHLLNLTRAIEDLGEMLGASPTEVWNSAIVDLQK